MYLWWPILYTYLVLVNYSVYKEHFDCLIFKYTSLSFSFFSISNTSSWPSLYTCDFYGLFSSLTCPLWDYVIDWYFMATCASGDLICTRNFTWWRILYSWIILTVLFCTHISPCLTYSLLVRLPLDLVFTVVILWPILFIYFTFLSLSLLYGYMSTETWYPIHYAKHILVTPSLDMELFNGLICTYSSLCWYIFYKSHHTMT